MCHSVFLPIKVDMSMDYIFSGIVKILSMHLNNFPMLI